MLDKEYTAFPEQVGNTSPLELYKFIHSQLPNPRDEVFYSHPITSSGIRDFVFSDETIAHEDKINNTIIGNNNLARVLIGLTSLDEKVRSLPANLGARVNWGEFDYNRFWFYFITGVELQSATQFEKISTNERGVKSNFNDYHGDKTSRKELYKNFVNDYINFVKFTDSSINPVSKIIFLPDSHQSLGCMMERKLAQAFGIPTGSISINGPDEFPDNLNLYGFAVAKGIIKAPQHSDNQEETEEFDQIYEEVILDLSRR